MILMPSANNMGSEKVFILERRLFIRVMKSKGPRIDPWGTLCCINPQSVLLPVKRETKNWDGGGGGGKDWIDLAQDRGR
jgi:hypothetical protein